jgi:hypothetical protein
MKEANMTPDFTRRKHRIIRPAEQFTQGWNEMVHQMLCYTEQLCCGQAGDGNACRKFELSERPARLRADFRFTRWTKL